MMVDGISPSLRRNVDFCSKVVWSGSEEQERERRFAKISESGSVFYIIH
jgi:hypothetical protein